MRRKPKRGTKPALRMAARRSRIRPASAQMALISLIFVTPMATSSSGLPGKLPDLIALATAPHPGPLPASGEREGPRVSRRKLCAGVWAAACGPAAYGLDLVQDLTSGK